MTPICVYLGWQMPVTTSWYNTWETSFNGLAYVIIPVTVAYKSNYNKQHSHNIHL